MDANYLSQHQIPNTTPRTRPFAAPARPQKAGLQYDVVVSRETAKTLTGSSFAGCRTDSQLELMDVMTDYGAIYEEQGMQAMYDAIEAEAAKCPKHWFS